MPANYFSIDEVNDTLPRVSELLGELLERRARVASQREHLSPLLRDTRSNVGSPEASEVARDFVYIEQLIKKIEAFGCKIKDLNGGTVDFLTTRNGREVLLCWRYGEPLEIMHYHALETGFMGRKPIREDDEFWTDEA